MKYSKTITLKDGRECVIRSAGKTDAKGVLDSFNKTHAETDFLTSYPDEHDMSVEEEEKFLKEKEDSAFETELCSVIDGKIMGTAGISSVGSAKKLKHRAGFGISVEKDFWGLGVGRALTESCIFCARQAGLRQLELEVVADNSRAVELYKSVGFEEYGRNPRGFYSVVSGWQELVLMRLVLD